MRWLLSLSLLFTALHAPAQDDFDPYYASSRYPKLTTPQWVGEAGVEAVVVLAIDDMRDPEKYEKYLRPILKRLQQIDGRAPVSIMTCKIEPKDPRLTAWLKEGLSLECHTFDHPCPFFKLGFDKCKATYDRCVDMLAEVPGNRPVAFRMPCCDSLNTPSPRFWAEIFNKKTEKGNYLSLDSSVFNLFTSADPELPKELVLDEEGRERFRAYLPADRTFVNTIENYPYPYVIGNLCWQFPCVTPSDWLAQHRHKPNNPITVRDWKAALDCTVVKKGVFCLVFHPHGWIKADQVVELIDHAVSKHGKKVKFLTFRDADERLTKNLLGGRPLRTADGGDSGIRLADRDGDGLLEPGPAVARQLPSATLPPGATPISSDGKDTGLRYVDLDGDGKLDVIFSNEQGYSVYLFSEQDRSWSRKVLAGKRGDPDALPMIGRNGTNNGFFVHSGSLWWANEDTPLLKDHVDRRSIKELLASRERRRPEDAAAPGPKSPEESLHCIQVRPGFKVELMAAEPVVQDPIAFAWGPDGKFWVVEMGDYPLGAGGKDQPGGRVKVLTKSKTDGPYDRATLFLDNLGYPTGVLPYGKGVLVTCAPDILYAEDTDGDGKADKKEVLYTGFRSGNQQHRVNGLVWGLDNWIYGANGDSGGNITSLKTARRVNISGRDFRIRPWNGDLEAQSGQTQFGRARDDWGNWFGNNNSNPMFHFVLDDHYLRRNPHVLYPDPKVQVSVTPGASRVYPISKPLARFNNPHSVNHFTSACSAIVYRDDLFGPDFVGNSFVSEPVHNLIHREIMEPKGVTFTSRRANDEQTSEFLASSDNWFRPTMLQTGPDGALWVADMYRYVIEHPEWIPKDWQQKLDLRAGHDRGRIYRIYPADKKPRAIPRFDGMSIKEVVACLDSPNGWTRDMAQQLLVLTRRMEVLKSLPSELRDFQRNGKSVAGQIQSRYVLSAWNDTTRISFWEMFQNSDAEMRRHGIRLSEEAGGGRPNRLSRDMLGRLTEDADPRVRLQLAYSLGAAEDRLAGEALASILCREKDRYVAAAALSSLTKATWPHVFHSLQQKKDIPPALLAKLVPVARAFGDAEQVTQLMIGHIKSGTGKVNAVQMQYLADLLDVVTANNISVDLSKLDRVRELHAAARKAVSDPKDLIPERIQAVRILARGLGNQKEELKILASLLAPQTPDDLQTATIQSLGRGQDPRIPGLLLARWSSFSPTLRVQVLDAILANSLWARQLVDVLRRKEIPPAEIDAVRRQRLLQYRDKDIRAEAQTLFTTASDPARSAVANDYWLRLPEQADVARGAKLFAKSCAACHKLGNIGNAVGPDLASVGDKSPQGLLTAILDPNRAVEARYVNYLAVTKNGVTLSGMLQSETSTTITLVSSDGKAHQLLRNELDELVSTGKSLMPEGVERDLSPQDLADIIAFVRMPK